MSYLRGVLREFKNIQWLSLKDAIYLSIIVVIVGILAGFLLGLLDSGIAGILGTVTR